jgi:uncharacterized protein YdhG (YjbR/CyaY superfamily)
MITNQLPNTLPEYLSTLSPEMQETMLQIRNTIATAVPEAKEVFSYQMPGFKLHGSLIWFAAFKNHYSVFVVPKVLDLFREELKSFETSKSTIQFPLDYPVQVDLIIRMAQCGAKMNKEAAKLKVKPKKK